MTKPQLDAHIRGSLSEALGRAIEGPDRSDECLTSVRRHREKYARAAVEIVIDALFSTVGDLIIDKLDTLDCDDVTRDMIENDIRIHAFDLMCRESR